MDIRSFGLDERLLSAAPELADQALLHEPMLRHAVGRGDNVLAKVEVASGREVLSVLPALQWLLSVPQGERRRVLIAAADRSAVESIGAAVRRLGASLPRDAGIPDGETGGLGLSPCLVTPAEDSEGGATAAPVLEGDPGSPLLIGLPASLLSAEESGLFKLKDFGLLIVEGGERLAELPSETLKAFSAALRPSWERRCIVVCSKISVKAKNLAWELADNPVELHIEEEATKAQGLAQETWNISADRKLRFLLGLLARQAPPRLAVFCNLKSSAEELALRLSHNGVPTDYILGALPLERKAALLGKLLSGESRILVLTDQGAEGLRASTLPLVVNYEIPLEPELYLKRLELLDRGAADAKVINLVCDRYACGLPAIESHIHASLEARPAEAGLLGAEDLSSAFVYERPRAEQGRGRRGGSSRAGRLVPPERHAPPERSAETRRDAGRPPSRRGRDGGRPSEDRDREDRRPEIWRSIAEATGGDFGREGGLSGGSPVSPSGREAEPPREPKRDGKKRETGRDQGRDRRGSRQDRSPSASRGPGRSGKKASSEGRGAVPPRGGRKSAGGETGGNRPESGARGAGNPYELPMEERMRRYREKYGTRLDAEKKDGTRSKGQGRPSGGEGPSKSPGQKSRAPKGQERAGREGSGRNQGSRGQKPEAARGAQPGSVPQPRPGRGAQGPRPRGTAPQAAAPRPSQNPESSPPKTGVLGKLLGIFKKKGD